jgi:hypothetical protein
MFTMQYSESSIKSISKSFFKIYSLNYRLKSYLRKNHSVYLCILQQFFYIFVFSNNSNSLFYFWLASLDSKKSGIGCLYSDIELKRLESNFLLKFYF